MLFAVDVGSWMPPLDLDPKFSAARLIKSRQVAASASFPHSKNKKASTPSDKNRQSGWLHTTISYSFSPFEERLAFLWIWASHHMEAFSTVGGGFVTSTQISPRKELSRFIMRFIM